MNNLDLILIFIKIMEIIGVFYFICGFILILRMILLDFKKIKIDFKNPIIVIFPFLIILPVLLIIPKSFLIIMSSFKDISLKLIILTKIVMAIAAILMSNLFIYSLKQMIKNKILLIFKILLGLATSGLYFLLIIILYKNFKLLGTRINYGLEIIGYDLFFGLLIFIAFIFIKINRKEYEVTSDE